MPFGGCRPILIGRAHRLLEGRPGRLASPQGGLGRLDEDSIPSDRDASWGSWCPRSPIAFEEQNYHVLIDPGMMASATFNSAVWGIAGSYCSPSSG